MNCPLTVHEYTESWAKWIIVKCYVAQEMVLKKSIKFTTRSVLMNDVNFLLNHYFDRMRK